MAVVLFVSSVFSQEALNLNPKDTPLKFQQSKINKTILKNGSKATNERWYNFGETMDIFYGNTSALFGNNLFPDTTILVDYGTSGFSGPWIHMLGDVLDVKSTFFNDVSLHAGELSMGAQSTYTVDSIAVLCYYERNMTDPNIVDTLLIEITVNNNLQTPYFAASGINTNLGSDTVYVHLINYSQPTNTLNYTTKKQYKFPLTEQFFIDSLDNGFHYIEISTADLPTVTAGKYVATALSFIPGYTWVANVDTLTQKNRFFFVSFKEQEDMFPIYVKRDFNISYIIPQDVRYNDGGSWNGYFVPSYAYMGTTADYSYEHHLIYYKTTCATNCGETGMPQIVNNPTTTLGNAYPNPASNNMSINIPLSVNANNAKLTVKNILGQVVAEYSGFNLGNNEITISTNKLASGIYLYTLEAGQQFITKKFSINK